MQYEKILRGVDGKYIIEKDVSGQIIPGSDNNYIPPVDGGNIILTIDSQIQFFTQKKLEEVVKDYEAIRAIAVIMDPDNGDIYAMAEYPSFDPNNFQEYEQERYKNLGISYTYEPGSIFKIINIASAIDKNCIGVEQSFDLPPSIQVGDKVIKEIFRTYNINYTTSEIIKYSSNIGAVVSALSMGKQVFYESIKDFGFGDLTGVNIPGEEAGLLYHYTEWPSSTIGALAIGQSISVTPLQMVRGACVLANGGYLVMPNIVKEIELDDDKIEYPESKEKKSIIGKESSQALKDMMLACVEDGTGKRAGVENVKICGKTGTAQKANQNGKGYSEGRVITSFVGFGPYNDPEIAIIVVVDEPKGPDDEVWGGTVSAPVFKELMDFSLKKLRITDS
jgi:stage V sporulation protein D (sporulation-specific penicillin-binding protein)